MNKHAQNPYAPPAHHEQSYPTSVLGLWAWLTLAGLVAAFGAPADWASKLTVLAHGIVCFGAGWMLTSSMPLVLRLTALGAWAVLPAVLVIFQCTMQVIAAVALFGAVSTVMGARAYPQTSAGGARLAAWFCTGYSGGALLGAMASIAGMGRLTVAGAIAGAAAGILLSKKKNSADACRSLDESVIAPRRPTRVT